MKNRYFYGTKVPFALRLQWFSPDLNVLPTELAFGSNSQVMLLHQRIYMTANKVENLWCFVRDN